ncbi:MAG: hypothetical protein AAB353_07575 [Candidatus Hydrogenedentota bacterium]
MIPREERLKLIRSIEQKRASKVICYVTSDRPNLQASIDGEVISVIHDHILSFTPDERNKIDLLLYSRGGQSHVPWVLVSMIREYCKKGSFSVLIPYRAHSAATVISLGADEIVMTRKAELGPIDSTISQGPYNPKDHETHQRLPLSVEDVNGYFNLLTRIGCERPEEKLQGFAELTKHVHPLALGSANRELQQTELVAIKLLNTRADPFGEETNRRIAQNLSSEIFSHLHAISRSEARELGLKHVKDAEDFQIDGELWDLYDAYKSIFQFETPFTPEADLISTGRPEETWENIKTAVVESDKICHFYENTLKLRQLRKVPPQVTINISNLSLPPINVGNLPGGIDANQIAGIVANAVQSQLQFVVRLASERAVESFIAALPNAGFERMSLGNGWKENKLS